MNCEDDVTCAALHSTLTLQRKYSATNSRALMIVQFFTWVTFINYYYYINITSSCTMKLSSERIGDSERYYQVIIIIMTPTALTRCHFSAMITS